MTVKWPSAAACCVSHSGGGRGNEMLLLVTKAMTWLLPQMKASGISCRLSSRPFVCAWGTRGVKKQAVGAAGVASIWAWGFEGFLNPLHIIFGYKMRRLWTGSWCVLPCVQVSFALVAAGLGATVAEWRGNKQDCQ